MAIEKILRKIISEYQEEKEAIIKEASEEKKRRIAAARKDLETHLQAEKERIDMQTDLKYDRLFMAKNSSAKLLINKKKKEALDRIFEKLEASVLSLPKKEYRKFYLTFIEQDSLEDAERYILGQKEKNLDESFVMDILPKGLKSLNAAGKGDFSYGIIFSGKNYDINLSFEEIMRTIREEKLTEIAGVLLK